MLLSGEMWEYRGGEEKRAWDRNKVREGDEERTNQIQNRIRLRRRRRMIRAESGQITEDVGISPPAINVVTGSTFGSEACNKDFMRESRILSYS